MKKVLFILISVLFLSGCALGGTKVKNISYDELNTKMTNNETFVLYIGSSECSHCAIVKPLLDKVVKKYDLEVYYINMANVTNDQYNAVKEKTNLQGTPTILAVKNGKSKTTNRLVGETDEEGIINFFKEIGEIDG